MTIIKNYFLTLCLTFILLGLMIYNFMLEIPAPKSKTIALDEQTLVHTMILPQIEATLLNSPLVFSLKGDMRLPAESFSDFQGKNPVAIHLPEGSANIDIPLLSIKTRNKNLERNIDFKWNSTSPLLGLFGFGTQNQLNQHILIKDNHVYLFSGVKLVETFNYSKETTMVGIHNTSHKLDIVSNRYLLKDKGGITSEFILINENMPDLYHLTAAYDAYNSRLNFSYDTQGKLQEISSSLGQSIVFHYSPEGLVSRVSNGSTEFLFTYHPSKLLKSLDKKSGGILVGFPTTHPVIKTRPAAIQIKNQSLNLSYTLGAKLSQIKLASDIIQFNYGKNKTSVDFPNQNRVMVEAHDLLNYSVESRDGKYKILVDTDNHIKELSKGDQLIYKVSKDKVGNITRLQKYKDKYAYEYDPHTNATTKITKNENTLLEREIINGQIITEKNAKYGLIKYGYTQNGYINEIELEKGHSFKFNIADDGRILQVMLKDAKKSIDLEWEESRLLSINTLKGEKFNFIYNANELNQIILPNGQSISPQHSDKLPSVQSRILTDTAIYKIKEESADTIRIWPESDESFYDIKLDSMNRPRQINASNKFKIDFYRNQNDDLSAINVSGTPVFLNLDSSGRPAFYLSDDGTYANLSYDSRNNLTTIETEKDLRIFEYDTFNRTQQISINTVLKYKFNYGPENSPLLYTTVFPDGTKVLFNYDLKGQLEAVVFRDSMPLKIENQNMGKTKVFKFPNNVMQFNEYENNILNFTSVTDASGQIAREMAFYYKDKQWIAGTDTGKRINIEYGKNGHIGTFSEIPGVQYQYQFNDSGVLKKMQTSDGKTLTIENNLSHNAYLITNSTKSSTLSTIQLKGEIVGNKMNFFEVNGIGQIIEDKSDFLIPNLDIKPGKNSVGLKGFLTSGSVLEETLTFEVAPNASVIYSHNNKNKPEYKFENGKNIQYEWNSFNQLIKYTDMDKNVIEYRYLPDGRLASKTKNGKTQLFVYDPFGRLIEEIASTGTSIQKYIYNPLNGHILISYDNKSIKYYHTDNFGNVINISNDVGKIVGSIKYHAYGVHSMQIENGLYCPVLFQGQYFDQDINLLFTARGLFDMDNMVFWSNLSHQMKNPHKPDFLLPFNQLNMPSGHVPFSAEYLVAASVPYELTLSNEFSWLNVMPNLPPQLEWLKTILQN